MRITLNGDTIEVNTATVKDILEECGYHHDRIATAVNGNIVHRHERADIRLVEGDHLEIVAPVSGG